MSLPNETAKPEYQLLWEQDFNQPAGTPPSAADWRNDIGDGVAAGIAGWGNQEREYYIEEAARTNGEGSLVITASRQPAENPYPVYYGGNAEWTSAKLTTYNKVGFKYGRIEARIKMASGLGTWPAFWMLGKNIAEAGWPQCGEIDIMEGRGDLPSTLYGTLHGPGYSGDNGRGKVIDTGVTLSDSFHVYAIEWLPGQIKWLLDGECYATATRQDLGELEWVYDAEFYLILNLAMGGHFTGPIHPDLNHAQLEVDFIRHYSIDGVGEAIRYS